MAASFVTKKKPWTR